jgi:hypothetical protein
LVQAARQWWKKFNPEIVKFDFIGNNLDPCLFFKQNSKGKCIITLYVNDSIIARNNKVLEETLEQLKSVFNVKIQGNLEDYLRYEVIRKESGFWIGQKRIAEELIGRMKDLLSERVLIHQAQKDSWWTELLKIK